MLKRRQLFEFCDQPWITRFIREGFMDCLNNIHRFLAPYQGIASLVEQFGHRLKATEILDLASGGGQQIETILNYAANQKITLPKIVLSDLYPNPHIYESIQKNYEASQIGYIATPIDIANIPKEKRILTIFTAFHHLSEQTAHALMHDVVTHRDSLLIVEFTRRAWLDICLMFFPAYVMHMLAPFFAKKFDGVNNYGVH